MKIGAPDIACRTHTFDMLASAAEIGEPCDVVKWAEDNVRIGSLENSGQQGAFTLDSREYWAGPLYAMDDAATRGITVISGTQNGKTLTVNVYIAFRIARKPCNIMCMAPNENLAKRNSEKRLGPLLAAIPEVVAKMPRDRSLKKKLDIQFADCALLMVGSGSPTQSSSTPCEVVVIDELDKCAGSDGNEADSAALAEERTKNFPRRKIIKTTTPTREDGRGWVSYLSGTQERYMVPCPHCGERIILLFQNVKWSADAKLPNGEWDDDIVQSTARYECQCCGGVISDAAKLRAIRLASELHDRGWVATNPKPKPHHRSFHLSSLYAPTLSWSDIALAFLDFKRRGDVQNFVNSWLAEPYVSDSVVYWDSPKADAAALAAVDIPEGAETCLVMTVDCQVDHYWAVIRRHEMKTGHSVPVWHGRLETIDDVRAKQLEHAVPDGRVIMDEGYRTDDVRLACMRYGVAKNVNGRALWVGWRVAMGMPRREWKDRDAGLLPYVVDHVQAPGQRVQLMRLKHSGAHIKDLWQRMREGRTTWRWGMPADSEWQAHQDAEIRTATGKGKWDWRLKSKRHPNHLLDCELLQIAEAARAGWMRLTAKR